jgi:uncharacterized membrane protein/protein-disulfide isomerase
MKKMPRAAKAVTPLAFPWYFWTVMGVCLAGLATALYLSVSHYRLYTDPGYSSFCAISKAINCDTVSQSPYAVLWGLPVAVWGVFGYLFFLLLLLPARNGKVHGRRVWTLLLVIAAGFSAYSIALAAVSTFRIGSYCILCITLYAVNLLLFFYCWIVRRRFRAGPFGPALVEDLRYLGNWRAPCIYGLLALLVVGIAVKEAYPAYWQFSPPTVAENYRHGLDAEGHPWMGAEKPVIEIVEFTDYQCFQCRKMYLELRKLIARYPDKIRLVHRHFPMDDAVNPTVAAPFHVGAGKLALLAIYAASEGKFWEMNDLLYQFVAEGSEIDLHALAAKSSLPASALARAIYNTDFHRRLMEDIRCGMAHHMSGTPSYLIDGRLYEGGIPAEALKALER